MKRKNETTFFRNVKPKNHEERNEAVQWNKFDLSNFCTIKNDTYICDPEKNKYISPFIAGSLLIAEYYAIKYGCNIAFTRKDATYQGKAVTPVHLLNAPEFSEIRRATKDYRKAFLYGMDDDHAMPIIYLKAGGSEGILIADSLGAGYTAKKIALDIKNATGINVYLIEHPRQCDTYSCYTDALLFARDTTAFNPEKNEYYIPDLLSFLKSNSMKLDTEYFLTKLPDELLKTCQISSFLNYHKDKNIEKVIHKNETISNFRIRYTDRNVYTSLCLENEKISPTKSEVYSYPRKKSIKLHDIMQIQFYLNQIDAALENGISRNEKLNFINQTKIIIGNRNTLTKKTQLYQFSYDFMIECQKSVKNTVSMEKVVSNLS